MCVCPQRPEQESGPLELEFQVVVSHLMRVLGTEPRSSESNRYLHCWLSSPTLGMFLLFVWFLFYYGKEYKPCCWIHTKCILVMIRSLMPSVLIRICFLLICWIFFLLEFLLVLCRAFALLAMLVHVDCPLLTSLEQYVRGLLWWLKCRPLEGLPLPALGIRRSKLPGRPVK